MGSFGLGEIIIILLIIILLFSGKKIPKIAKGIGEGIRLFKKALRNDDEDSSTKM